MIDIGHVEDANAAESLGAHGVGHALRSAVQPAARLLDGHEHQVPVDGEIALTTRANH